MRSSRNVDRDKSPISGAAYYDSDMKQINTQRHGAYSRESFFDIDTRQPGANSAIKGGGDYEILQKNLD